MAVAALGEHSAPKRSHDASKQHPPAALHLASSAFGSEQSFAGAATPLLYRRLGMDPASNAGPLDTALQDVLANSAFLAAAGALISFFGY